MASQLALDIPELQKCDTCRWYVEIVGLGRPHPERCRYANAHGTLRHLVPLPKERWCLDYEPEQ